MAADKKSKIRVGIKSDGTPENTSLVINGSDITKTMDVTGVNFSVYSDGDVWISWTVVDKDDKGVEKRTSYSFRNSLNESVVERKTETVIIGKDSEIQFESESDKAAYHITQKLKKLEDDTEVKDLTKKES